MTTKLTPMERRDEFYRKAHGLFGFEKPDVVKILRKEGYETFRLAEIPKYLALLKFHAGERDGVAARLEEWRAKIKAERKATELCPIPDCGGEQVRSPQRTYRWFPWKCSKGGSLHYHAWAVAGIRESQREALEGASHDTYAQRRGEYALHILEEISNRETKDKEDTQEDT